MKFIVSNIYLRLKIFTLCKLFNLIRAFGNKILFNFVTDINFNIYNIAF